MFVVFFDCWKEVIVIGDLWPFSRLCPSFFLNLSSYQVDTSLPFTSFVEGNKINALG